MTTQRPTLATFATRLVERGLGLVQVSVVAEVLSYDRTKRTAKVQPLVSARLDTDGDGDEEWLDPPAIDGVPVVWSGVTWDLAAGDRGILLIRDRSHDEVDASGAVAPVQPASTRRFNLADAVFLPEFYAPGDTQPAAAVASGARVIYVPTGDELRIGSGTAAKALALAQEVAQRLAALETAFNTLTLPVADATAGPPAAPLFPVTTTTSDVASTRILTDDT